MEPLYIFVITFIASFIGSLQLGPVNLLVVQTSVNHGLKPSFVMAVGGCLPEILYAAIAVAGAGLINPSSPFFSYAGLIMVPLLLGIGLFKVIKYKDVSPPAETNQRLTLFGDFMKGLSLSLVNPLILPFWSTVLIYNTSLQVFKLDTLFDKILFVSGAAAGALALLLFFAFVANRMKERINKLVNGNIDRAIGWLFIALSVIQLIVLGLRFNHLL